MSEPIRVLQVVGRMRRGGMETLIMNIYRNIDRAKVQFDFLVHYSQAGEYDDEIRSLGGKIYCIPVMTNKKFFRYEHNVNEFFKNHKEFRIVHGHWTAAAFFYLRAAKVNGVPMRIVHSHSTRSEKSLKGFLVTCLHKPIQYVATDYFSCSKDSISWLISKKALKHQDYTVINNAIDVTKYAFDKLKRQNVRLALGVDNSFVVGHVGTFSEAKNHLFLLKVFEKILLKVPNAVMLLVGGGGDENTIREQVKSLGLSEHVRFLGICDNVAEIMMAMDVFVFPSLFEGFPVVLVEAQAACLPCLTSKEGVTNDIKMTEIVSFLPLNQGSLKWAEKAIEIANCERVDLSEEISSAGFSIANTAKNLQNFYLAKVSDVK